MEASLAAGTATVRLVYLARLRDAFGTAGETLALPAGVATVGALLDALRARGGAWGRELAPGHAIRVALDHALADAHAPLAGVREIALLPPVTGG